MEVISNEIRHDARKALVEGRSQNRGGNRNKVFIALQPPNVFLETYQLLLGNVWWEVWFAVWKGE